jgi:hypothetical protein
VIAANEFFLQARNEKLHPGLNPSEISGASSGERRALEGRSSQKVGSWAHKML